MTKDEALKLALEALEIEESQTAYPGRWLTNAISAIKEALAQPEQDVEQSSTELKETFNQPVAWLHPDWPNYTDRQSPVTTYMVNGWIPLYTTPPQRKPLTDEEMFKIAEIAWRHGWASCRDAEYIGEEAEDERWGMVGAEVVQDIAAHGIKE